MRQRLSCLVRLSARLIVLTALASSAAVLPAQTFIPPALPTGAEQIAIPTAALPAAIHVLLEKGRSLELTGRWADARLKCGWKSMGSHLFDALCQIRAWLETTPFYTALANSSKDLKSASSPGRSSIRYIDSPGRMV